jgi:hypothetical protein
MMSPQEVLEKIAELGIKMGPTTLQNYRVWGLITPPVMKTLGRGKGRSSDYAEIVPGEVYAASRLMRSDFGFSAAQIRRFRALWTGLPNPDKPWPFDLITRSGALLWALLRNVDEHGTVVKGDLNFSIYPADEIPAVFEMMNIQHPGFHTDKYQVKLDESVPGDSVKGLVIIRTETGRPIVVAVAYSDRFDVIAQAEESTVQ